MASNISQMIGTVLGAAAKELISSNPPTNSGECDEAIDGCKSVIRS